MSPWLFNVFMDSAVKEMDRVGRGVQLVLNGIQWDLSVLLYADDAVLISNCRMNLEHLVREFERVCSMKKLKINPGKSKVMCVMNELREIRHGGMVWDGVRVGGEELQKVSLFRYLGVDVGERGGLGEEMNHRVAEGKRVLGALKGIWGRGGLSREIKVKLFESICLPTILYGCETWSLNAKVRRRMEVLEMDGLRSACNLRRIDRVRNERIKQLCNWEKGVVLRMEQGVLRWFGHVIRMNDGRIAKKVFDSNVEGDRGRGRPKWRWMDGVRVVLGNRNLSLEEGMRAAEDRNVWKGVVYG